MKGHWIENHWVGMDTDSIIDVHNPATEELLDQVPSGSEADVEQAVAAAKTAFDSWRKTPAIERSALLHEASARMRTNWDDLVTMLTLEEGKPVAENEEEALSLGQEASEEAVRWLHPHELDARIADSLPIGWEGEDYVYGAKDMMAKDALMLNESYRRRLEEMKAARMGQGKLFDKEDYKV